MPLNIRAQTAVAPTTAGARNGRSADSHGRRGCLSQSVASTSAYEPENDEREVRRQHVAHELGELPAEIHEVQQDPGDHEHR